MTDTPQTFEEWFKNYNGPMTYDNCWNAGRASMQAAKDRRIAELESEWRVREGYHQKLWNAENDKNHLLQAQIDRVRALAERYITREEHNNIIHMNETVHKRDVAERIREALQEVAPIVEFYLKREIESPSNHQEFAREAQEKLNRFRAAARTPGEGNER